MSKKKIVLLTILILIVAGICVKCFVFSGNFSKVAGIKSAQIDKVTVQTDWGKNKTITSQEDIHAILACLDSAYYTRNDLQLPYTGYLYNIYFYQGDKKLATILLGHNPEINDVNYTNFGTIDTNKLEKIVGLYPPGY